MSIELEYFNDLSWFPIQFASKRLWLSKVDITVERKQNSNGVDADWGSDMLGFILERWC